MNELTLDGKTYVSSKRAAEMTGYAKDYVGQLCREGRVEARLVGRNWYILKSAIEKHRFASENPEPKVEEPIPEAFAAKAWEQPRYKSVEAADLPAIEEPSSAHENVYIEEEASETEPTTVEAMQDAWRSWFSQKESGEEVTEEVEIAPEPVEEAQSTETAIPLHSIARDVEQPEVLNLRRIREYKPEEAVIEEEPVILAEKVRPIRTASRGYARTLQAAFILLAVIALGVGYYGAGFAGIEASSRGPASIIAGVSVYNR